MLVAPQHFVVHPDNAAELFRITVNRIDLEIASFCNRRCSFCPNSFVDRISERNYMSDALFRSILTELGAVEWRGTLALHRYNEPLADRAYLLRRLRECATLAPRASVRLQTNGDYLDPPYLQEIYDSGCRDLFYTVYLKEGLAWSEATVKAEIVNRLKHFELPFEWEAPQPDFQVAARVAYRDMAFLIRSQNFSRYLTNRGGSIDVHAGVVRTSPCLRPFQDLQIEYDGTLMPCCECRSDYAPHQAYVMGRLAPGDSVVAAWTNKTYVAWRTGLFAYGPKQAPCSTCVVGSDLPDTAETRDFIASYRLAHGLDARERPDASALADI